MLDQKESAAGFIHSMANRTFLFFDGDFLISSGKPRHNFGKISSRFLGRSPFMLNMAARLGAITYEVAIQVKLATNLWLQYN